MKILMVCLGNICRSPLAEGIFRREIEAAGLDWNVDSAGTSGFHEGELPDPRSIQVARQFGLDITAQRSRKVTSADFKNFDYIFAMDQSNLHDLLEICNRSAQSHTQIHRLLEFAHYPGPHDVPDPYWNDHGFLDVFAMLEQSAESVIQCLLSKTSYRTRISARNHVN